jgi:hypothetical protein
MTRAASFLLLIWVAALGGCIAPGPPKADGATSPATTPATTSTTTSVTTSTTTPGAWTPAREVPAVCVPEGQSCAAAQARCCIGLICAGSRQPTCVPRY